MAEARSVLWGSQWKLFWLIYDCYQVKRMLYITDTGISRSKLVQVSVTCDTFCVQIGMLIVVCENCGVTGLYTGYACISIIRRFLTWTTRSSTCAHDPCVYIYMGGPLCIVSSYGLWRGIESVCLSVSMLRNYL